ncbi:MAG: LemA family protein, partial [Flavobacteriales bacterium]
MRKHLGLIIALGAIAIVALWAAGFYNGTITASEAVEKAWGDVLVRYQERADKTKNLLEIVKGAADFEQETITQVVEARSKASSINLTADQLTPENLKAFEDAQAQFSGALSRLLVTIERYPDLKAVAAFRDFQAQYEGMENRISVERRKFNDAVRAYNLRVKRFPGKLLAGLFGFEEKG